MKTQKMKSKSNRVFYGSKKSTKRSVQMRGDWKAVELDPGLFAEEGLEGLICFEELTNYRMVDSQKAGTDSVKEPTKDKKKAKKRTVSDVQGAEDTVASESKNGDQTAEPAKKKAKKKNKKTATKEIVGKNDGGKKDVGEDEQNQMASEVSTKETAETSQSKKKKNKKKESNKQSEEMPVLAKQPQLNSQSEREKSSLDKQKKLPKNQAKNWTNAALSGSVDKNLDVSAWKDLFVPSPVLKALSSLGFSAPTPIQALALPPAIRDHMDIVGAAETGSGKTLAFGIPMIHTILEYNNNTENPVDDNAAPTTEDVGESTTDDVQDSHEASDQEDEDPENQIVEESEEEDDGGCVQVLENIEFNFKAKTASDQNRPLLGLILTPTRELAVQVKHHLDAVAKFTKIKTAIVVGGMAQQKQRRMLNHRPEIVIATPGRLWDLIKEEHPHLLNLRQLKCLVIDEADRMIERGHFAELENLLEMLNTTHYNPTRQSFVFSATLTMAHSLPTRLLQKKKNLNKTSKLEILMEKVGIRSKPKVIDLTRKEATVETLTETQIRCQKEEKDFYLYYFLLQYPGRTMVFANSIDCIKRLNSLLVILDCNPLPLHANMHQKQRLKNLERFAERESCVLLTTDVAARGLDIPNIQHVIHYQVPRTSETYVHRSGRTARATKEGLSLLLIGPDDVLNLNKIYKTLGKDEELPVFPIESKCMQAIEERVNLARKIEKIEFYNSREKQHNSWFRQAAEALEVDLDEDLLIGGPKDEDADKGQQKMVKGMKKHLKHLISQPIFKNVIKTKYPTQLGKLPLPMISHKEKKNALTSVLLQKSKDKLKKNVQSQQKKEKQQ